MSDIKAATKHYRQMAERAAKAAEARDRAAKDLAFMVDGVEGKDADDARAALKEQP